jgi:hypothetical protein
MIVLIAPAFAQHFHPPKDSAIHEQFYLTWMIPNGGHPRHQSCCNLRDCYPTEIKFESDTYYARHRDTGEWVPIPPSKLEHLQNDPRESPDGRSHACIVPHGTGVLCAVLGNGM